jgi:hypothetical protein
VRCDGNVSHPCHSARRHCHRDRCHLGCHGRQAQVTERSLAQTERSLAEQNERSRLNLELDLLTRLGDRFESPHFLSRRRAAAKYLIDNVFVEDDEVEVGRLNRAVFDVCNYAGTRARVEAKATLEQAEKLSRVLDNLRERMK